MESLIHHLQISKPENGIPVSSIQVLQVYKDMLAVGKEDTHLPTDGICICHAHIGQTLKVAEVWIDKKEIDAVIVDHECAISDIESIKEVASRKAVPLFIQTLKYDWKAREMAIECGCDEYHIGSLDQHFAKRVRLIKRVKSLKARQWKPDLQWSKSPSTRLWMLKRLFDMVISASIIALLLPILLIILPLLILDTKGSILSGSQRVGKNYKIFTLYKFRYFATGADRKITGIWQLISKLHLVGIPQILNVLKGDMSIVGNYPVTISEAESLTKDGIAWRFLPPVGIFGLWRFNHSIENKTSEKDYTQADLEYTMSNSMWLDIKILLFHFMHLTVRRTKKEPAWALHDTVIVNDLFKLETEVTRI
jgi:lipopolysaccharide/colanic/teichoic acid biosynthesis glycosyltransferase